MFCISGMLGIPHGCPINTIDCHDLAGVTGSDRSILAEQPHQIDICLDIFG
jgi:hypothetical protein